VLSLSPAVTLPLSAIILASVPDSGMDEPWWELRHLEIALLPGLADLLPFLWLVSRAPDVRRAAFVAGLLGMVRYAVPQAATLIYGTSYGEISIFFVLGILAPMMLTLWLVTLVIAAVMLLRGRGMARPGAAEN
jgi:hypothetical protein